jgi:hypothetical protein
VVDFRTTGNLINSLAVHEDLGAGNDYSYTDLYNGISGVPLTMDLNMGAGSDGVLMNFGKIVNSKVTVNSALGDGTDMFNAVLFSGVSGTSIVNMNVAGQTGADRVDYNLMGKIDSTAAVNIRADNTVTANDRMIVRYRGELDGTLTASANGAASIYGVQALFALDPASTGSVTMLVQSPTGPVGSTARVTDHTGGPKVTVLDRLEDILTEGPGLKVNTFVPVTI